jgi:hypothetical protein
MTFLNLVNVPKKEVPQQQDKPAARQRQQRPAPAMRAPARDVPDAPAMTVVMPPAEPSEPVPEVAPLENGVKESSLGRAGTIDKDLRDKSFFRDDRKKLAYERPKFERDMEAAGKPRGPVVVEEIVAPGGRKITRINGKCYYAPHGYNSIMRDPFKSGPPPITLANCPREK